MDDYCGLRNCPLFGRRSRKNGSRCPRCDTSYDHWYRELYCHHYNVREDHWSRSAYDSTPSGLRDRSFEYGRTIFYSSQVQETRDSNRGAGHRDYDEQHRSYSSYESNHRRTPSPSYRSYERSRRETHRRRSRSSSYSRRNEVRRSSSSRHRPRERSRRETHRRRSRSSSYSRRNKARRSSSSRHRPRERSRRETRRRRSPSEYRDHARSRYKSSGRYSHSPKNRHSERSGYDHRDQRHKSRRDDRYRSRRSSTVSDRHPRRAVSPEHTREYIGNGENREIPHEQRTVYEVNGRRDRPGFEQPRYQEHQPVLNIEEQRESIPDPLMQSPPSSVALPLSARQPEQEIGVHGEDFNLKDVRQKRFINCGIECLQCRDEGQHADHPEFACGTMYEIFTHYVGPRIRNQNQWCQICRHEGRLNISKHHTAEQCKLGMWCDHPGNDLVEQKACFRKWNHPYPGKILGYEPGTVIQMYRNMWRNRRTVNA